MPIVSLLYLIVLFVALTPGVLIKLPMGSKLKVAAVHGLVFVLVWNLTHRFIRRLEGFQADSGSGSGLVPVTAATINNGAVIPNSGAVMVPSGTSVASGSGPPPPPAPPPPTMVAGSGAGPVPPSPVSTLVTSPPSPCTRGGDCVTKMCINGYCLGYS
jgi:hypothetical protein